MSLTREKSAPRIEDRQTLGETARVIDLMEGQRLRAVTPDNWPLTAAQRAHMLLAQEKIREECDERRRKAGILPPRGSVADWFPSTASIESVLDGLV